MNFDNNTNADSSTANQTVESNAFPQVEATRTMQDIGHSMGQILREARMSKGMTVEEVSRQLRLSVQQITAIEQEDYEKLPGKTFLRGFIRNYSHLVQLDPVPLLKMLPESARIVSTHENTPLRGKQLSFSSPRNKTRNYSLPIIVILAIFLVGGYFLLGNDNQQHDERSDTAAKQETPRVETATTATKEIQLTLPTPSKVAHPTINKPEESTNAATVVEEIKLESKPITSAEKPKVQPVEKNAEQAALTTDPAIGNLHFKFNADSWIRVVDGTGTNLLEQVKKAGSEHVVSGKKPFSIILGNAPAVNLTYNNKEINVSSYQKQGGTARFTLD